VLGVLDPEGGEIGGQARGRRRRTEPGKKGRRAERDGRTMVTCAAAALGFPPRA
jgi:hypothetical protein